MQQTPQKPKRSALQYARMKFNGASAAKRVLKLEKSSRKHAQQFIVKRIARLQDVRRHVALWAIIVTGVIGAAFAQHAMSTREIMTDARSAGGTYIEGVVGKIETLNPLYATSAPEVAASKLLFSSLYSYDNTGGLRADLTDSLTIDPTGTVYTVKIRPNVKWHDGKTVEAGDVAYTVQLMKDPRIRSVRQQSWRDVDAKAVGKDTVVFTLPAKYASFRHALTFPVLPKHVVADIEPNVMRESGFSDNPTGSGPFRFRNLQSVDSANAGRVVHMLANEDYYRNRPYLNRFELRTYTSMDALEKAFNAHEVNAASDVTFSVVPSKGKKIIQTPVNNGAYALFNTDNPILKDAAVRQALQVGINTKQVRDAVKNNVTPLDLPYIPSQVPNSPGVASYDKAKANEMLDKAGWALSKGKRMKDKTELVLKLTTIRDQSLERAAKNIITQLSDLGITAKLEVIDTKQPGVNFVTDVLQTRNFDILVYELVIGGDPDVFAYWHSSQKTLSGYNFTNYTSVSADSALASARDRLEPDLRNAKYIAFAKQWIQDVPAVGLYRSNTNYAVNGDALLFDPKSIFVSASDRYADVVDWALVSRDVYKTP